MKKYTRNERKTLFKHTRNEWKTPLKHTRNECEIFPRSGTQGGAQIAPDVSTATEGMLRASFGVVGADSLLQLLKNYSRTSNSTAKTSITVGVIFLHLLHSFRVCFDIFSTRFECVFISSPLVSSVFFQVGIVGYPNVGKSSVINSLTRKGAVKAGGTAGVTRQLQEV